MIEEYTLRKNKILDSYQISEEIISILKDNSESIGMPNLVEQVEQLLTDIREKVSKINADCLRLVIVGESTSEKFAFINAYLGVELLPTDIKQRTGATIEIKYGKELFIRATYADECEKDIKGDKAVFEFLKDNIVLNEEYGDIPVSVINREILIKSGLKAKTNSQTITVSKIDVEALLNTIEVQEANTQNLPTTEYQEKIRTYIKNERYNWVNIVTKIEIFFPLAEEMHGIEIISTPDISVHDDTNQIASEYIKNTDAIIFLKSLSSYSQESVHFEHFINNVNLKKNKNDVFLVLTGSANFSSPKLKQLKGGVYQLFNDLNEERIFFIDSKAELYAKKLSKVDKIEAELHNLSQDGVLDDFVVRAWFDSNGDKKNFIKILQEKSMFNQIYESFEVKKINYILLEKLLDDICKMYIELSSSLNNQKKMLQEKIENPTDLSKKINKIKSELNIIKYKMFKDMNTVVYQFCGVEGLIRVTINSSIEDFKNNIYKISSNESESFDKLKILLILKINEFKKLSENLQNRIISEYNREWMSYSDKNIIHFESLKLNFSEITFDKISKLTESEALEEYSYERGFGPFKKIDKKFRYTRNKHVDLIKESILLRVEKTKSNLISDLEVFACKIRDWYIEELSQHIEIKRKELDILMQMRILVEQFQLISQLHSKIVSAKLEAEKNKSCYNCLYNWRCQDC